MEISIRAPAKGATWQSIIKRNSNKNFNPRSREGSDETCGRLFLPYIQFQSALPRRERPASCRCCTPPVHFNPRSREGSDEYWRSIPMWTMISIRAPAKGATVPTLYFDCTHKISIRAPAKGATIDWVSNPLCSAISIRAPAKGATLLQIFKEVQK